MGSLLNTSSVSTCKLSPVGVPPSSSTLIRSSLRWMCGLRAIDMYSLNGTLRYTGPSLSPCTCAGSHPDLQNVRRASSIAVTGRSRPLMEICSSSFWQA